MVVTERSIPIRLAASWSFDAGYAFWRTKADVVVAGPEGALDDAVNLRRVFPFNYGGQTLAAMRFGHVFKLDDVRDTLPPGQGTQGILMDQLMESLNASFSRANPAHLFEFVLELDDVPGLRHIESVHYELSWGNTTDRVMRIYTSEMGEFNLPRTVRVPLNLYYIPSPGGAALLLGALALHRRRR